MRTLYFLDHNYDNELNVDKDINVQFLNDENIKSNSTIEYDVVALGIIIN